VAVDKATATDLPAQREGLQSLSTATVNCQLNRWITPQPVDVPKVSVLRDLAVGYARQETFLLALGHVEGAAVVHEN
jgi:hypothetical protein